MLILTRVLALLLGMCTLGGALVAFTAPFFALLVCSDVFDEYRTVKARSIVLMVAFAILLLWLGMIVTAATYGNEIADPFMSVMDYLWGEA